MPRARGLSSRPKKKKVEWLEEEPDDVLSDQETGEGAQVEGVLTTGATDKVPFVPPSPLQQKQDDAMDLFVAAMESWEAAQEVATRSEPARGPWTWGGSAVPQGRPSAALVAGDRLRTRTAEMASTAGP